MGANPQLTISRHGCNPDLGDWSQAQIDRQYRAEAIKWDIIAYLRTRDPAIETTTTTIAQAIGQITQRVALVINANTRTFQTQRRTRSDSTTLVRLHPHLLAQALA